MHGYGWWMSMRQGDEKPKVTRQLLLRVLSYARGYWWHIAGMLVTILLTTGLSLLTPLIFRNMIDVVIPAKDTNKLILLGVMLLAIPAVTGVINVFQRRLNAT
ncbi:MAG: ABC transporter ATP-binding protein, partial [Chloroflexota bacterium]